MASSAFTLEQRLWSYVDWAGKTREDCWPWLGTITARGQAKFYLSPQKRGVLAHRVVYSIAVGPIPEGAHIDHICHDPQVCALGVKCPHRSCCNPAHMRISTQAENNSKERSHSANRAATHCKKGHLFDEKNTIRYRSSDKKYMKRKCRTCGNARQAAYRARQKSILQEQANNNLGVQDGTAQEQ